ncbi:MAG: TolC family protein [Burkholderiaceae bacterium]|nr:TolC family protein [Burkholderiaceae bacterium]
MCSPLLFRPLHRLGLLSAAVVLVSGCASVSPDGLRGQVQALTAGRTAGVETTLPSADPLARSQAQTAVAQALARPVTLESAIQIALLNNPGLQARLSDVGIADAQRVQALTLPNPHLTLGRLTNLHEREIERSLAFNLLEAITLPWRSQWQNQRAELAVLQVAQDAIVLAADTRRAWLRATAAEQVAVAYDRMHEAAQAGAQLGQRMVQAGNWSRLQQAREQAVLADSSAQAARARLNAGTAREQLTRLMGLSELPTQYTLAEQLPALPTALTPSDGLETQALQERLDLRAARQQLDSIGQRQGWSGANALFGNIGLAYKNNLLTDRASGQHSTTRGWELELPVPLFDWGGAARARAGAEVEKSAALLQEAVVRARSEVRAAWLTRHTAYELARQQRDEVLPLRRLITEETTLRYNGMLVSVWDLLAEARASTQAVAHAIEAQRDFWLADTDLQLALTGTSPGSLLPLQSGTNPSNSSASH